jgi:diguanylate cyclase (GGDEF)-like protein/PAS domain S-box-containing protein
MAIRQKLLHYDYGIPLSAILEAVMKHETLLLLLRSASHTLCQDVERQARKLCIGNPDIPGSLICRAVAHGIESAETDRQTNVAMRDCAASLATLTSDHAALAKLLKFARDLYFELLDKDAQAAKRTDWGRRILHAFDRLEIAVAKQRDLRDKARTERLHHAEQWTRSLFESVPDPQFLHTLDGYFLDVNSAACERLGYSREQLLNMCVSDIDKPLQAPSLEKTVQTILKNGSCRFRTAHVSSSGEIFPVEIRSCVVDSGDTPLILSSARDMSEMETQRKALQKSEEKFRRIFETMKDAYILTSMEGAVLMANPSALRQIGLAEHEVLGKDVTPLLYANPADRKAMLEKLAEDGALSGYLVDFKDKDGATVKGELNVNLVYNEQNEPVALEGIFRDVTDRIEAEREMREREEQYRGFFMNNHAVMLLHDPNNGNIIDANPAAERFYGHERGTLLSMNINQLQQDSEEDVFREMVRAGQQNRNHFLLRHKTAGGRERDVEVYSGPVMVNGRMLLYSVIHDVTERRRLGKELQRLATEDSLTGVYNRREFLRLCEKEFSRSRRYRTPLSLLMLDLDNFKTINDTHGHKIGDEVLQAVTACCREALRESDVLGRIGGEEFAVALPQTDSANAAKAAHRLCKSIRELQVQTPQGPQSVTVSIGLAAMTRDDHDAEETMHRADKALYSAKRKGRNRVEKA